LKDGEKKQTNINVEGRIVIWEQSQKDLFDSTSILFGVHRGVIRENFANFYADDIRRYLIEVESKFHGKGIEGIDNIIDGLNTIVRKNESSQRYVSDNGNLQQMKHIDVDFIRIDEIEQALRWQFKKGESSISYAVKNAFFNTVGNGVEIESGNDQFNLPDNFLDRLQDKKDFLLPILSNLDSSKLKEILINLIEIGDTELMPDSKIFRALLINILAKAEEENIELKSISKLIEIFNNHLFGNKKLVIDSKEDESIFSGAFDARLTNARIFLNENGTKWHTLDKLSSGERHLLSFLTLFLIISKGRDFF
jgi:hypothetical protein